MDRERRRALIERYREGPVAVATALAGVSDAELDARPPDGSWTAREVAHHVADSELTAALRLRRLLAEERPAIDSYDEEEFARRLHYDRPIAASLDLIRAIHASTAEILDRLGEAEWARLGSHPDHATYGVERWLEIYAAHCFEHAEQIGRALGRDG